MLLADLTGSLIATRVTGDASIYNAAYETTKNASPIPQKLCHRCVSVGDFRRGWFPALLYGPHFGRNSRLWDGDYGSLPVRYRAHGWGRRGSHSRLHPHLRGDDNVANGNL